MTQNIKAAVIGVGHLGSFHAEKYARCKKADLVAVVDNRAEAANAAAKKNKTQMCADYKELPAMGVQCASVATDTIYHYEIASWLLENGIDVLIEKPITVSIEEAKKLIALAEKNKRIIQVGHIERFNPSFRAMEKLLSSPWFFEVRRLSPFTGRGKDIDVVLDLMIHDIDIIAHLVGKPLEKVDAVGIPVITKNVDIANARLTFQGGAVANVTASRVSFKSERSLRIFQPDVYINLDYGNKKLKMYSKKNNFLSNYLPQIATEEYDIEDRDALEDQINSFIDCVINRSRPIVSGVDGLVALELVQKIRAAFADSLDRFSDPNIRSMLAATLS